MKALALLCLLLLGPTLLDAAPLLARVELVDEAVETFDPVVFGPGPTVDVYHLTIENPNSTPVSELSVSVLSDFVDGTNDLNYRPDSSDLPTLGPNVVAESFFIYPSPSGTTPLAVCICQPGAPWVGVWRDLPDDWIPAGGMQTVAVISIPTGEEPAVNGLSGMATVGPETFDVILVPEAASLGLALLGLLGPLGARR